MIIIVLQHNFCHPHQPMCYKSIEIFDLLSDSGKTNTTDEKNMNDATNGKDTKDNKGDGAVDNAVDDATDAVDDLTDNNGPENLRMAEDLYAIFRIVHNLMQFFLRSRFRLITFPQCILCTKSFGSSLENARVIVV